MYRANYSQLKAVSSCLCSLVHQHVSIINMIVMWHEWSSEEVLVTVDRRQESTCARYSVLAAISCHYNIITSPATSSPTIKIDPELIGEGQWHPTLNTLCCYTLFIFVMFVKLREREGQRVDLGRSLNGHLWMVDGGWWYTFPWCFTLNLVATTTTTTGSLLISRIKPSMDQVR